MRQVWKNYPYCDPCEKLIKLSPLICLRIPIGWMILESNKVYEEKDTNPVEYES